ncbi:Fic family protein [Candidatus Woesearchaeota archaeon]|nr:Fic family protein [Candidatus Woesearchaeota archaeon]
MVNVRIREINRRKYPYAEHSFRLPDGAVKKISKLIKDKKEAESRNVKDYFLIKETESYSKYALSAYKPDIVLTKEKIAKIESFRVEYRQLLNRLTKKQMSDILDRFTVNFTYESNAIEGNSLTLKDVTLLLNENIVPKGRDLREIYETRNTRTANEMLFNNKIKINLKSILNLHSALIRDTGVSEGFKKLPNFLLMRDVKTTAPEKVEKEMQGLLNKYNQLKGKEHPLRIAAQFHGTFEKIHPFEDGNGRVGRILINAILIENGFPPLIIRKTMRASYFKALEAYDKGYKTKLERFLLEKMEKTFKDFFKIYVDYL